MTSDVVKVKVGEAAAVLVLHPHAHHDDGLQLLLDVCASFSHIPDSEVGRVHEVVMKEFQLELLINFRLPLLWLLLHLQIAK